MKKRLLCGLLAFLLFAPSAAAADLPAQGNIRIAIIDTGISSIAIGSGQLVQGYNYLQESNNTEDHIGHGTAVAALLTGASSAHVVGISPRAKLVPLVFQTRDKNGKVKRGNQDVFARAIRDAIDIYGCRVINISVGTSLGSKLLREAVDYAEEKDVVVISSVGNSNKEKPELLYLSAA